MPTIVILLSDKRSGSTMFEREICKHADIAHIPFTPHTYNETHYWLMAASLLPMPAQLFSGNKPYKGYGSRENIRQLLIDTIQGNVPKFIVPDDDEALVFDGWEALCEHYANPVLFEKSPQHPHHWAALELMLRWVERTKHQVKFIGLVRNPMSVMYSAQALFFTNPEQRQFGWAHAYRNILLMQFFLKKDQFYCVRYEDLTHSPRKYFGEVCDFIGVDGEPEIGASVHEKSLNKWREDSNFDLQLDDSVIRIAKKFGYSEAELLQKVRLPATSVTQFKVKVWYWVKRRKIKLVNRLKVLVKSGWISR